LDIILINHLIEILVELFEYSFRIFCFEWTSVRVKSGSEKAHLAVLYTPPPFLVESARSPRCPKTVRGVQAESKQSPNNPYVVQRQSEDSPKTVRGQS